MIETMTHVKLNYNIFLKFKQNLLLGFVVKKYNSFHIRNTIVVYELSPHNLHPQFFCNKTDWVGFCVDCVEFFQFSINFNLKYIKLKFVYYMKQVNYCHYRDLNHWDSKTFPASLCIKYLVRPVSGCIMNFLENFSHFQKLMYGTEHKDYMTFKICLGMTSDPVWYLR